MFPPSHNQEKARPGIGRVRFTIKSRFFLQLQKPYKINTQKSLAFLYTNNEKSEREIKE